MTMPTEVLYGLVTWTAVSAVADGADVDGNPDAVPVGGTVTFTPSSTVFLDIPSKVTVIGTPVTYTLDAGGVLRDSQGRAGVTLLATDSPGVTPTGWTWQVQYRLNGGLSRGSFSFALPAGTTVDLTTVAPVSASGGAAIIQGPPGPPGPAGPTGAVSSVNGHTGAVSLTAADVSADPTGAASTAQAAAQTYVDTTLTLRPLLTLDAAGAVFVTFTSSPSTPTDGGDS